MAKKKSDRRKPAAKPTKKSGGKKASAKKAAAAPPARGGKKPAARKTAALPSEPAPSSDDELTPVVGIGASAGGLAALKEFFGSVPKDSGLSYVVVVHLSPDHESHLAELLQPHVGIPVQQVHETTLLEPNHVYVIPPNANLNTIDTHLRLSELEQRRQQRAPIDHFFRTLAQAHDGHAIGIILTGTGSDGTLGIKEIKGRNGFVVVQDPNEAEYDGMPQSALATGMVDKVLPVGQIAAAVIAFARTRPQVTLPADGETPDHAQRQLLQKVFAQIRARTGRDFSHYKQSTILRRIRRRMQLHHVEQIERYLALLRESPDEVRALADDMLITVTNFFRDAEVFDYFLDSILPDVMSGKSLDDEVRVWSVGCATGEEAYTLAMLLIEYASQQEVVPRIQVFASDLHEHSLRAARDGFYPGDIETDVSPERLKRFFQKENGGYRIRKDLREMVVFAPHNLLGDPPFSRLDVIFCRNLLIYLQRGIQQDVSELFHYALRPNGYLVLGSSETLDANDLFRVQNKKLCVHRKRDVPAPEPRLPVFPVTPTTTMPPPEVRPQVEPARYGDIHLRMLERSAPPSILVSPDQKIVHFSDRVGRYLVHPGGDPTTSVFKLVRDELRMELRSALSAALETKRAVTSGPVPVHFNGDIAPVVLHVWPAQEAQREGFALVIFDERAKLETQSNANAAEARRPSKSLPPDYVANVESELEQTRQRLQALIEEYETGQEEMKASNEELQSANEELRSTMEELETSKEELQSMNEELQTVNQENRHKVEELAQLSSDLQNLLAATDIATLFLDRQLRILRFTPRVSDLFNIRVTDRSRPISDLTHRLGYPELAEDAAQVLKRLTPVEREVRDDRGNWYLARVLPYRSTDDRIEGVVITLIDITQRKRSEDDTRVAKEYAETIIATLPEPLLVLDGDLVVKSANAAFYQHFEVDPGGTLGRKIYLLGNGQWDIPALRKLLEDLLPNKGTFSGFEVEHHFQSLGRRVMRLNARRLSREQLILLGISDVTERVLAERTVRENERRLQVMLDVEGVGVVTFNRDGFLVDANNGFLRMFGYGRDEVESHALHWRDMTPPEYAPISEQQLEKIDATGRIGPYEKEYFKKDGSRSWMLFAGARVDDKIVEYCIDVGDRKRAEEALRESEARYRSVVNQSLTGVMQISVEGRVLWVNEHFCKQLGYSADELQGRPIGDVVHPDDMPASEAALQKLAEDRRPFRLEKRLVRKDGTTYWVHNSITPVLDEQGAVSRVSIMSLDITERIEAEESLRQSEEQLRLLNESLEEQVTQRTAMLKMLQDITRAANEARSAEDAMRAAMERIARYNGWHVGHVWRKTDDGGGELVSSGIWHLEPDSPLSYESLVELRRQTDKLRFGPGEGLIGHVLESGQTQWIDDIARSDLWRRGDVSQFDLRAVIAFPVFVDAEVAAVIEFFSDHPTRRDERFMEIMPDVGLQLGHVIQRMRLDRRVADAAEQEQRRIGQDIHDGCGQEITGLKYLAQTHAEALQDKGGSEIEVARRIVAGLEAIQKHLRRVVRDLVPVEIDAQGLVVALQSLAERTQDDFGVECQFDCDESMTVEQSLLATHVYRIAQEAVNNAAKHAGASRIDVRLSADNGTLQLTIADDGIGIAEDAATKPGFGLRSMARRAALVGGRLAVEKQKESGTIVTCLVPRWSGG